jgi:DNA adenine methylase
MPDAAMQVTALLPWYGSNRTLAHHVGAALAGCTWVGIPFLGGASELAHITARTVVANDLHRGVINLCLTLADPELGPALRRRLRDLPFHADALAAAQARCRDLHAAGRPRVEDMPDPRFAADYFVCAWMGRSGKAGTAAEYSGALPVRWNANGGDSAVRFRSAVASLRAWRRVIMRANFTCMDAFDFLAKCKDEPGAGIYSDSPFPDAGDDYRHHFTEAQHRALAVALARFRRARVVARFYDHSLIRELYPEPAWTWHRPKGGRKQTNEAAPEVLLVNDGLRSVAAPAEESAAVAVASLFPEPQEA